MTAENELHIAEIPYESGGVKFRYARKLSSDGQRWIRHGRYEHYAVDGTLLSEGQYVDGKEEGVWRDYQPNGNLAAEGQYSQGEQVGHWRYWSADGNEEYDEPPPIRD
ncbi:hypothetical protein C9I57_04445 [Trinickia symbiotica]|uniref:Toxin-antitoxin system YwqK family antitoxin n=1 Tax=Trinickia symbiotica TaxID=863227 RepID=A0A2T3Y092_9BURK|nr:hypothetical protein [Trinickia symbiotica]PTB22165.1 hypothetical protein C9I57_04445 [Trinickia symbiotica]